MNIFTEEEIQNARNHKYSGSDDSLLVNYLMKYVWNWMVELFPMWLAPNVITLLGFLLEVASFSVSIVYSKCMTKEVPDWVCILDGVCLLVYQTLDNLDGKQARRTGSSSALGQFFDHGCDAITGVMELVKLSIVLQYGPTLKTFILIFCMSIGFFSTSWEELVTHKFYLGYLNGPDEGLFLIGWVQIFAGIFPGVVAIAHHVFWEVGFLVMFGVTMLIIFYGILKAAKEDCNNLKVALVSLLPCSITATLSICCIVLMNSKTISPFFIMLSPLMLQFGGQLIIVNIIMKRPLRCLFPWPVIIEWLILCVPIFEHRLLIYDLFWYYFLWVHLAIMVIYDIRVIIGLSAGLGIPVFTISPRPPADGGVIEQLADTNDDTYVLDDVEVDVDVSDGSDHPETA